MKPQRGCFLAWLVSFLFIPACTPLTIVSLMKNAETQKNVPDTARESESEISANVSRESPSEPSLVVAEAPVEVLLEDTAHELEHKVEPAVSDFKETQAVEEALQGVVEEPAVEEAAVEEPVELAAERVETDVVDKKPEPYQGFLEWCEAGDAVSENAFRTVQVLLDVAGTMDCSAAYERFLRSQSLSVSGKFISDLRPFSGLNARGQIRSLSLEKNQIQDISVLQEFDSVRELWLGHNQISSLTPLRGMHELRLLTLQNQRDENGRPALSDLTPLSGLYHLEEVWLTKNAIEDVKPLSGLSKLRRLFLSGNRISNVGPLISLTSLEELYLSQNKISSAAALGELRELKNLRMTRNPLADKRCPVEDGECSL